MPGTMWCYLTLPTLSLLTDIYGYQCHISVMDFLCSQSEKKINNVKGIWGENKTFMNPSQGIILGNNKLFLLENNFKIYYPNL